MVGPPGTGKTLLARAVAGEAGVPFFHISGSEFVEMFVGVEPRACATSSSRPSATRPASCSSTKSTPWGATAAPDWAAATTSASRPSTRSWLRWTVSRPTPTSSSSRRTNRPDILDPALLRPGRFDRRVTLDLPDVAGREAILKVHVAGKPLSREIKIDVVARETPGFSGADLSNLVNEAALLAARKNQSSIFMQDFEEGHRACHPPARSARAGSSTSVRRR